MLKSTALTLMVMTKTQWLSIDCTAETAMMGKQNHEFHAQLPVQLKIKEQRGFLYLGLQLHSRGLEMSSEALGERL